MCKNKLYSKLQRVLALALVTVSILTQVAYAYPVPADPLQYWTRSDTSGKSMKKYNDFESTFKSSITTNSNYVMDGFSDSYNRHYGGLNNASPSPLMIAEYLSYMLIDCWWADSNMLYDEDTDKKYNLFYSRNEDIKDQRSFNEAINALQAIKKGIQEKFPQTTNNWDGKFGGGLYDAIQYDKTYDVFEYDPKGELEPGTGGFLLFVQGIKNKYLEPNIAGVLASKYMTKEEIASVIGASGVGTDYAKIYNYIGAKMQAGTLQAGGSQTTDTPPSEGEGEGDIGAGETTLPDVTPETPKAYAWAENIDYSKTIIVGDSSVIKMAKDKGWIDESYSDYVLDLAAEPGVHPAVQAVDRIGMDFSVVDSSGMSGISGALNLSNYMDAEEDCEIIVIYGVDRALSDSNCTDAESYKQAMLLDIQRFLSSMASYPTTLQNITFVSNPSIAASDFEDYATKVPTAATMLQEWNTSLSASVESIMSGFSLNTAAPTENLHARVVPASGDYSDMEAFWSSTVSAHTDAAKSPENITAQEPTTTEGGYSTQLLRQLYLDNATELDPYFAAFNNIVLHIESCWANTFANEGDYTAYTKEYEWYTLELHELSQGMNDYGYKKSDVFQKPKPGQTPGDTPVDNEYLSQVQTALEMISNAKHEDGEVIVPNKTIEDVELTPVGYVAFAAGVIYDPFVSTAGDDTFFEVVRYMLPTIEDANMEKMERLLHEAYTRKKPLYVLDGSKSAWAKEDSIETAPSGEYRLAKLSDLLQSTTASTRVYTVVKGGMDPSTVDASTWEYVVGDRKETNANGSNVTSAERTDDDVTISSDSAKPATTTVAGATLVASSQEMSAPVMFSSGAKTALFTGNWDGSASGYAANLGGLTTMIVHNAAQDAKSNDAVQHPEDYMLFMNGLGDIVLADNTMILPAVANPACYNYDAIQYDVSSSGSIAGTVVGGLAIAGAVYLTWGAAIPMVIGVSGAAGAAGTWAGGALSANDFFSDSSEDSVEDVLRIYDESIGYYPYTAAFMNHYPSAIVNSESKLALTNNNDVGKMVIGIDENGNILARAITDVKSKAQAVLEYSGGGVTVAPIQGLSFDVTENHRHVGVLVPFLGGEDGDFWSHANMAHKFEYYMTKDTAFSGDDQAFFPLNNDVADLKDSYLKLAGPLVLSAERFVQERVPVGETTKSHPTFNVQRYIGDMCGQGLIGTQYGETLQKNYQISYDEMVADTGNRFLTFMVQLVESAVDTLGSIDGVLAIKNGYENRFFNIIVQFIQEFYLLIAVVLLVIVAVKFLKGHYNFIFVAFIALLCFCGFEVYANWMPTMIPAAYNFAVNDAVEHIAWNTLAVSAESYAETYLDSDRKDATTGTPKPYTTTVTLYKMSQDDMELIAGRLNVDVKSIKSGDIYYLDETAGIFVQGDSIKISVDKLLVSNTMRGLYHTQWEELAAGITSSEDFITPVTNDADKVSNPYSIQLTQPYVSLEAYYMPYNEIERAFMVNLNAFASVFRFERNQFNYSKNLYKDAFLFNCYTNSGIFTSPGSREVLRENIRVGSVLGGFDYGNPDSNEEMLLNRIYGGNGFEPLFEYPTDWLNVAAVFRAPSQNMKESLWGKMLQYRGWYDDQWNIIDAQALSDLISYINIHTKQFVIQNSDQLNFCSDENAIKMVSLYATTCFTHYVSQYGSWLYPNYLNAADIELKDVLYGSMTTLRDRNIAYDGTVVNTVAHKLGVFGVLFILLITVLATVFVFTVTYLVPVLYALLGVIIVYKLINDRNSLGLVQGYIKVTAVTCLLYFIFSLSLRLVEVGGYAWYGYLGCALLMLLCCYFLFWVCISVVQNVGEMGNDVLGQNLLRGIDSITHGAVRKLTTNTLNARRGIHGYGGRRYPAMGYGSPYEYGRGYGIDGRDYVRGSRSALGAGRDYGAYSDGYGSYGRSASYEETVYEQEGRRGLSGVLNRAFNGRPSRRRAASGDTASNAAGVSRYASRERTIRINQSDIDRLQ